MTRLVYYFDIGNTRLKLWRCQDGQVDAHWAARHDGSPAMLLAQLPGEFRKSPQAVAGASVLDDRAGSAFSLAVRQIWGRVPAFARAEAGFRGLRSAYRDEPGRLGVDRWLGMMGVAGECDAFCVVGCGTAVTIDVVRRSQHLGGFILPGLLLMETALLQGTGKVRFDAAPPRTADLGVDTATAVRNGALCAVAAVAERVCRQHAVDRLVLTGGDAAEVARALSWPHEVDPDLLLRGMMRYFDDLPDVSDEMTPEQPGEK